MSATVCSRHGPWNGDLHLALHHFDRRRDAARALCCARPPFDGGNEWKDRDRRTFTSDRREGGDVTGRLADRPCDQQRRRARACDHHRRNPVGGRGQGSLHRPLRQGDAPRGALPGRSQNAGHTLVVDGETFALQLIPSGVLYGHITPVIGNGVVVDPRVLLDEVAMLEARGIDCSRTQGVGERPPDPPVPPAHRPGHGAPPRQERARHHQARRWTGLRRQGIACGIRILDLSTPVLRGSSTLS